MAIDFFDIMCRNVRIVCSFCVQVSKMSAHAVQTLTVLFKIPLHMWETKVKVTETKQTAFPPVAGAAAVTFCPGRLGPGPGSANLFHSVIRPVSPVA